MNIKTHERTVWIVASFVVLFGLAASGCTTASTITVALIEPTGTEVVSDFLETAVSTSTSLATPETEPSSTEQMVIPTIPPPARTDLGSYSNMLHNEADGARAPEFSARAMGNWTFSLSAQRGSYLLVIPTVAGCADCVFSLQELSSALSDNADLGLRVVILNLYPNDVPESWQYYADLYSEHDLIWSVVNDINFSIEYQLESLGTAILIDPEGYLIFQRSQPLYEDEYRQLFDLVRDSEVSTS